MTTINLILSLIALVAASYSLYENYKIKKELKSLREEVDNLYFE